MMVRSHVQSKGTLYLEKGLVKLLMHGRLVP